MIDHLGKQTQPLELEQKRSRGRPATGQALSNAERQRRYREAQKAQRNEKVKTGPTWEDTRALMAMIDTKNAELEQAKSETERLANKVLELERQLKELNKSNVTEKPIKGLNYRKTKDAMLEACKSLKTGDEDLTTNWRFGALRMWETITRDMSVSREQRKKDEKIFREMAGLDTE